jgi:hypothetical protein
MFSRSRSRRSARRYDDDGRASARRAVGLLDLTIEDMNDLFALHGVALPVEL